MTTLVITRGLPAAGKTTYATAWVAEDPEKRARINRDELRNYLYGVYWGLTHDQEERVTVIQKASVRVLLERGVSVVVDDTNLRMQHAKEWGKLALSLGVAFEVVDVKTPVEECLRRDMERQTRGERAVGAEAIKGMNERYALHHHWLEDVVLDTPETPLWIYDPDTTLPRAFVVDIDGTLAHMTDRGPFDWDKVGSDSLDALVSSVVDVFYKAGYEIVVVSGRDEVCRDLTAAWLDKHRVRFDKLIMRAHGDVRPDEMVKEEIFWRDIAPSWNVQAVLDDRDKVVRMWRRIGVRCLQVADGNF